MKLILESTEKLVRIVVNGVEVPARVWQGTTESGIECHAYLTRVAVKEGQAPEVYAEFERALHEHVKMRPDIVPIPLRLIL